VIGAGPSGIAAAKAVLDAGSYELVIYDRGKEVGGVKPLHESDRPVRTRSGRSCPLLSRFPSLKPRSANP